MRSRKTTPLVEENATIDWPPMPGSRNHPRWNGSRFLVGQEEAFRILVYSTGETGWDDDLAGLVRREADENTVLGKASREFVLQALSAAFSGKTGPSSILEIGSANGYMLESLGRHFPDALVAGSEYSLAPLENLADRIPDTPLLQFDLTRSPLPDNSFDAIVSLNVLEHIEDDILALSNIYRMLRPGGVAVIEVPAMPSLYDAFDDMVRHYRRYRMQELLRKSRTAGFEIVQHSHLGFFVFPAFWLVKKKNRWFGGSNREKQKAMVVRAIRNAPKNRLLNAVFQIEAALRNYVYYPFGIRCLCVCRK